MKTILAILLLAVAALASGCNLAPRTTEAASTKIAMTNPLGRSGSIELPKNLKAEDLHIEYDPITGVFLFKARVMEADASTVIESAGAVQAEAMRDMATTINALGTAIIQRAAPRPSEPAQD